jgi:hypothetical protein
MSAQITEHNTLDCHATTLWAHCIHQIHMLACTFRCNDFRMIGAQQIMRLRFSVVCKICT